MPGRLACLSCEEFYTTRVGRRDDSGEGVGMLGDLERLAFGDGEAGGEGAGGAEDKG